MDTDVLPEIFTADFLFPAGIVGLFILIQSAVLHQYRRLVRRWRRTEDALQVAQRELTEQLDQLTHLARVTKLDEMSLALAHELRQPIAAIISSAQAAQRYLGRADTARPKVAELLADINLAGRHAGEVISRQHAMSRRERVAFRAVQLNDLVTETLQLLQGELALRGVTPTLELADNVRLVRGDPVQLKQVVVNLVCNACDAMASVPPAERMLVLRTGCESPAKVWLAVSDRGPGLTPAVEAKLFQPFQTAKPEGLGLGLAICRAITKAHLGVIQGANNPDGRGAVFSLSLPVAESVTSDEPVLHETAYHRLCRG